MSDTTFQIVDDFYNASWDLACNLFRLYEHPGDKTALQQNVLDHDIGLPLTVPAIRAQFDKYTRPFMDLTGQDLPLEQHLAYMTIEDCLNETIIPGLEVLGDDWQDLYGSTEPKHETEPDAVTLLRQGCSHLRIEIENTIITSASGMVQEMKPPS